jgi:endonuclease
MPLYEKPVRQLMHDMVADLGLRPGQVFDREQVLDWFRSRYPLVKEGTIAAHLIRLSTNARSRLYYNVRTDGSDDLFFQVDGSRFRLYELGTDPAPITLTNAPASASLPPLPEVDSSEASQFAYEQDLRDFLVRNLSLIEPGLKLYSDEGITGVEFPVGRRYIDILAVDRDGGYVVIELKVSKGYDRVVGQLLRYMGWVEKHHAEPSQRVRGVIVAKEITEDLKLACARVQGIQLYEYALSVTLTPASA